MTFDANGRYFMVYATNAAKEVTAELQPRDIIQTDASTQSIIIGTKWWQPDSRMLADYQFLGKDGDTAIYAYICNDVSVDDAEALIAVIIGATIGKTTTYKLL